MEELNAIDLQQVSGAGGLNGGVVLVVIPVREFTFPLPVETSN
ncbi:MAG TPA: hypothetical protein VFR86_12000 [Burkholderiaceae bacterium]|nr:hypothetical protein [Burkholderiaceae bacterium]